MDKCLLQHTIGEKRIGKQMKEMRTIIADNHIYNKKEQTRGHDKARMN